MLSVREALRTAFKGVRLINKWCLLIAYLPVFECLGLLLWILMNLRIVVVVVTTLLFLSIHQFWSLLLGHVGSFMLPWLWMTLVIFMYPLHLQVLRRWLLVVHRSDTGERLEQDIMVDLRWDVFEVVRLIMCPLTMIILQVISTVLANRCQRNSTSVFEDNDIFKALWR